MSNPPEYDSLCERCSLLSFDDAAIGGYEVIGEDSVARLHFPESRIECRPLNWLEHRELYPDGPWYRLIRLGWELDDNLPDMPRLARSSELGCGFCRALRRFLVEAIPKETKISPADDGPLKLVAYLSLVDEDIEGLVVEASFKTVNWISDIKAMFPFEADPACRDWLRAQPVRDSSYLTSTNIQKMHQLLDHCTSTCHPDTPSQFMPTRLIDIGHDVSAIPRLVLSSNIGHSQQIRYAALSYCWGSEKDAKSQLKTEKASLESRFAGLPSELLKPITNDAIALTRALNLRYLWIDALCIIQDDNDDWLHESSQMNLVYRHAFVTFCNLNSNSCHESFLDRAPAVRIPFQSTIRKATKGFYLIRLQSGPKEFMKYGSYTWDVGLSKWNRRCWTFQEKEMSTRLLLFGSLRMHFTCARSQWSEGDEAPSDRNRSMAGVSDMITRFRAEHISSRELHEYWDWLVFQYGHRSVTFDKDRLPAIAGLARIIGETLQDQYLAGLWKGDLHHGLIWYSQGDMLSRGLEAHIRNMRERNYVAPSWSWATCPYVITVKDRGARIVEESTIVDVNTDTHSEDPYGRVSGGFLRIRGKIARMPSWLPKDNFYWSYDWYHFFKDTCGCSIHVATDWLHKEYEAELEKLVVMLLCRIENDDGAKAPSLWALLLHPADESQNYYRVGVVESTGTEAYREVRSWFEESQEETICII